jgi:hypothetical protein
MQLAKRGVDRLSRGLLAGTFGNNTLVGGFVRNALNSFTNPQFPSDEVNDLPFLGLSTKNGLYTSLYNGGVNNNKNAIGNLLTSFATPKQISQNIGSPGQGGRVRIGGAAIDLALNVGFSALQGIGKKFGLSSKRGGGNGSLREIKNPLNSKDNDLPIYPSDYATKSFGKSNGTLTGIATGEDQLMREGERFYTKYEGINAEKQLNTIRLDGKKYTSLKPALSNFIGSSGFKGYITYDEGAKDNIQGIKYKFIDVEGLTKEDLKEVSFSKNVYKEQGKGESTLYNGKNAINTKLFVGVKRQKSGANITPSGATPGGDLEEVDVLNSKRHTSLSSLTLDGNTKKNSDLISIYLKDVNSKDYIMLMSNLTGLTDTPTPTWGDVKPIGSPNKFYFYESFEREISFKGQLYAKNEKQLVQLWQKVEFLQNLTLASWGGTNGIQGKICELKIGNFVDSSYGFLTNCTITIPDNSPWEIQENSQVPFICEFDITYKVIPSAMSGFNEMFKSNEPIYDYNQPSLPGLNFGKKLQPGNTDIKKLQGLGPFFGKQGSDEAGMEGTINQNSFTGGETSTSEVPNILDPEKWQTEGSGEAPNGSGIFNTIGTDTTDELIPTSERGRDLNSSNEFKINPTSTPKSSTGMLGGAPQ